MAGFWAWLFGLRDLLPIKISAVPVERQIDGLSDRPDRGIDHNRSTVTPVDGCASSGSRTVGARRYRLRGPGRRQTKADESRGRRTVYGLPATEARHPLQHPALPRTPAHRGRSCAGVHHHRTAGGARAAGCRPDITGRSPTGGVRSTRPVTFGRSTVLVTGNRPKLLEVGAGIASTRAVVGRWRRSTGHGPGHVVEPGVLTAEGEPDLADGTVAVLGHDDLGHPFVG